MIEFIDNQIIRTDNDETKKLLELIKEHPDLEVVPMIDSYGIDEYESNSFLGSFGCAHISKISAYDDKVFFDKDDLAEYIYDMADSNEPEEITDNKVEEALADYNWLECIIVNIGVA